MITLISLQVSGQSLQVMYGNQTLTQGQEITITGSVNTILDAHLTVKNIAANNLDVHVKRHEIFLIDSTTNYFCYGGLCYGPSTSQSPSPATIAAGAENSTFTGYCTSLLLGVSTIGYTFFDANDSNDSMNVIVHFEAVAANGINDLNPSKGFSSLFPNPSSKSVSVNFNTIVDPNEIQISLLDLNGKQIEIEDLNVYEDHFTINTSILQSGSYYIKIRANGTTESEQKLIVTH